MGVFSKAQQYSAGKKLTEPLIKSKRTRSTQNLIPVYRISKNGIFEIEKKKGVHLFDKAYYLKDINYATENEAGQQAIIEKWCMFLNTFNIAFKIVIANHRQNMEELKTLFLNQQDDKIAVEMDRINEQRIEEGKKGIAQRKYFIVTVEKENYEDAKAFFDALEAGMTNYVQEFGSNLYPMDWKERLQSLHRIYRLGHETEFPELNWEEMITLRRDWKNDICNISVKQEKEYLLMDNDLYTCVLFARSYPSSLTTEFITEVTNVPFHAMITLDVVPIPDYVAQDKLMEIYLGVERDIQKQQELLNRNHAFSNEVSYDKRKQKEKIEDYMDEMRTNNQSMFHVGYYVVIQARSEKELNSYCNNVLSIGQRYSFLLERHDWQQLKAFHTALPLGGRYVKTMRSLFTQCLAALPPFYVQELQETGGLVYGINRLSKNLVTADRKQLPNGNGFILAGTGGGKSVNAKNEFLNVIVRTNDDVILIDPQNEYFGLAKERGGQVINFHSNTKDFINPLHMPPMEQIASKSGFIAEKLEFMLGVCEQALEHPITPRQRSVIDRSNSIMFHRFFNKKKNHSPTMKDFRSVLLEQQEPEAEDLALTLETFVDGSLNIFSQQQNVDLNNRILCFGINDLSEGLRPLSMLIMLEVIQNKLRLNAKKGIATRIYVDEFHCLTGMDFTEKYLEELWKKIRKMGGLMTGITQNISDLLQSKRTATMVANSEFVLLLRQAPSDLDMLQQTFKLSDTQLKDLMSSAVGVGLMKFGNQWIPLDSTLPKGALYDRLNTNMHEKVREGTFHEEGA